MRLLRRRSREAPLPPYLDDGTLPVLVVAADPAVADSAVLATVELPGPVLVRHHLTVRDLDALASATALLAQDGYSVTLVDQGPPVQLRAWRVQVLTALSASQERSRMAGLVQRHGGQTYGWDALGPDGAQATASR